jgi:hypothetical protein
MNGVIEWFEVFEVFENGIAKTLFKNSSLYQYA